MTARPRAGAGRVRASAAAVVVASALALGGGFLLKDRCTTHDWAGGYQYRTSCYNDVYVLYFERGLDTRRFPYLDGDGDGADEQDGDVEYPVLTGLYMGLVGRIAYTPPPPGQEEKLDLNAPSDARQFFRLSAVGLAVAGLAAVGLTAATAADRRRGYYFALAPSLALYAFHNWDLLAVALTAGALFAFRRGTAGRHREAADAIAGVLLGLGAAAKLYPGLLLPALALARWRHRRRVPVPMLAGAAAAFAIPNVVVLALNPAGWLFPWSFQSTRIPNYETSWYSIFHHLSGVVGDRGASGFWFGTYPKLTGYLSGLLFLLGAGLLVRAEARRAQVRPYALGFGILLVFLLTGKVFSPQFALWLLPFFVLVRVPWYGFAAFAVSEAGVWFAISAWFLEASALDPVFAGIPTGSFPFWAVEVAVLVRYAVLGWLLWMTRRADENVPAPIPAAGARGAPVGFNA